MQEQVQVSKTPLVDILSKNSGSQVVMRGSDYVDFNTKELLSQASVDAALLEQEAEYQKELEAQLLAEWKASRTAAVANIKVTVDAMEFDGDEISQGRMARAIVAMSDADTITWVLADNTPTSVTKFQLAQALKLAGEAQTALWVQ